MSRSEIKTVDFWEKAITPPPKENIAKSVEILVKIGALNADETLTLLGNILVGLPVDVRLGKMLVMSSVMGTLQPILTLASMLALEDPFVYPTTDVDKTRLRKIKTELAKNSYSDAMVRLLAHKFIP
jgi:HrpA-like RNA helicase